MVKKPRNPVRDVSLTSGLVLGLIGLSGCSEPSALPASGDAANQVPGSKRDAIEKKKYESLKDQEPGKSNTGRSHGRR